MRRNSQDEASMDKCTSRNGNQRAQRKINTLEHVFRNSINLSAINYLEKIQFLDSPIYKDSLHMRIHKAKPPLQTPF